MPSVMNPVSVPSPTSAHQTPQKRREITGSPRPSTKIARQGKWKSKAKECLFFFFSCGFDADPSWRVENLNNACKKDNWTTIFSYRGLLRRAIYFRHGRNQMPVSELVP